MSRSSHVGLTVNKHVGNKMWRDLIKESMNDYATLPRSQRQRVTNSIVMAVRSLSPPGRFLMMDNKTGTFYDIGDAKANVKTAQAMRDSKKKRGAAPPQQQETVVPPATSRASPCEEAYAMVPPPLTSPVTMAASVAGSCVKSHQVSLASSAATPYLPVVEETPVPAIVACPPPPMPSPRRMDRLYSDDTFDQQIQNLKIAVPTDSVSLVSLDDLEETELQKLTDSCSVPVTIELTLGDLGSSQSSIDFCIEDWPEGVDVQDVIEY